MIGEIEVVMRIGPREEMEGLTRIAGKIVQQGDRGGAQTAKHLVGKFRLKGHVQALDRMLLIQGLRDPLPQIKEQIAIIVDDETLFVHLKVPFPMKAAPKRETRLRRGTFGLLRTS